MDEIGLYMLESKIYNMRKWFPDLIIRLSDKKSKKYVAIFKYNNKIQHIHFGQKGYDDYTTHRDQKRRELFRKRFENEMKDGKLSRTYPLSSLFWSYNLLW
jgi:hypothetical protein